MMEKNESVSTKEKAKRVLYLVIATVLVLGVLIAGIAASIAGGRGDAPLPSDAPVSTPPKADEPNTDAGENLNGVTLIVPTSGSLMRGHDLTLPVWSPTLAEYRVHSGIDIACEAGAEVRCGADGVITDISNHPLLGKSISVTHAGGLVSVYRNLAIELPEGIEIGATVASGSLIGYVGESAMIECADEAHLHFEVYLADAAVDPLDYLDENSVKSSLSGDTIYEG